jgi:hypothetical protein
MRKFIVCVVLASLPLAETPPLGAQADVDFSRGSNWTVGFVANAPNQLLGAGVILGVPALRGWGLYLDAKFPHDDPARDVVLPFTPSEAEDLGDEFFNERSAWTSVNAAAVLGLTRELAAYLGAGYSRRTNYLQYVDPTAGRGELGRYWVEDFDQPETHVNVLGGAFFRMGRRLVFQIGAQAAPAGFTAGGHVLVR